MVACHGGNVPSGDTRGGGGPEAEVLGGCGVAVAVGPISCPNIVKGAKAKLFTGTLADIIPGGTDCKPGRCPCNDGCIWGSVRDTFCMVFRGGRILEG